MNIKTNASNADSDGYIRPAGFPNGEAIIAAAPDIVDGGTTYQPIFYICEMDNFITGTYDNASAGIATGADAYVFSDEPTVLRVGSVVTHTFNRAMDYSTNEGYKVRYVIAYATAANKASVSGITINMYNMNSVIEFIAASGLRLSNTARVMGNTAVCAVSLKYANLTNIVNTAIVSVYFLGYAQSLKTIILSDTITSIFGGGFAYANVNLSKLQAKRLATINGSNTMLSCYSFTSIDLPSLESITGSAFLKNCYLMRRMNVPLLATINANGFMELSYSLKYISLPSLTTVNSPAATMLTHTSYIALPANFNITGANFTGSVTKSIEWFHHLATQLFDRSATTTGTLILGAANIALIPTADAATIAAKNWTLT